MKTKKRNYQLIFWSLIYEWFLYLGFWELRKLQSNSEEALKNYRKWRDYDYNKNKI